MARPVDEERTARRFYFKTREYDHGNPTAEPYNGDIRRARQVTPVMVPGAQVDRFEEVKASYRLLLDEDMRDDEVVVSYERRFNEQTQEYEYGPAQVEVYLSGRNMELDGAYAPDYVFQTGENFQLDPAQCPTGLQVTMFEDINGMIAADAASTELGQPLTTIPDTLVPYPGVDGGVTTLRFREDVERGTIGRQRYFAAYDPDFNFVGFVNEALTVFVPKNEWRYVEKCIHEGCAVTWGSHGDELAARLEDFYGIPPP